MGLWKAIKRDAELREEMRVHPELKIPLRTWISGKELAMLGVAGVHVKYEEENPNMPGGFRGAYVETKWIDRLQFGTDNHGCVELIQHRDRPGGFYDVYNGSIKIRFVEKPLHLGDFIKAAGEMLAGIDPAEFEGHLSGTLLKMRGVTHVDATERDDDGMLGVTTAIPIDEVRSAKAGEFGFVRCDVMKNGRVTGQRVVRGDVRYHIKRTVRVREAVSGRETTLDQHVGEQWKQKYEEACSQLVKVYEAATGRKGLGPEISPEQDALRVREERDALAKKVEALEKELATFRRRRQAQVQTGSLPLVNVESLRDLVGVEVRQTEERIESYPGGYAAKVTETVRNRGSDYGHPSDNHELTASLWNQFLTRRLGVPVDMSAEDVCSLNVLQKLSRLADKTKDDSWLDVAGYAENVSMLRPDQRNGGS